MTGAADAGFDEYLEPGIGQGQGFIPVSVAVPALQVDAAGEAGNLSGFYIACRVPHDP